MKHTNPRSADQDKKVHYNDVHSTNFFLSYVPAKAKNTMTVLVIHSKEGTACGIVVSDTQALNSVLLLLRGLQEKLPDYPKQKGKKAIECSIENFVPRVAVTRQKAVPSIELSPATGDFEREKEVEDTMLDPLKPFAKKLKENDASSSTPKI